MPKFGRSNDWGAGSEEGLGTPMRAQASKAAVAGVKKSLLFLLFFVFMCVFFSVSRDSRLRSSSPFVRGILHESFQFSCSQVPQLGPGSDMSSE